ncbi:hypothetical protein [Campylobacter upsaliensis]|uniref:hypothetical protein n=1 Tax=Campylobacter upsaliensis TaxID=28080 RepID=UPI0022EB8340|nr:hypothetical protein [Campylobacter upsaliensis]
MQASWYNGSNRQEGSSLTVSTNAESSNAGAVIYTNNNRNTQDLTINSGVIVGNTQINKGIEVNSNTTVGNITNSGHIIARENGIGLNQNTQAGTITMMTGSQITANGAAIFAGKRYVGSSTIQMIKIENGATVQSIGNGAGIHIDQGSTITTIQNAGTIKGTGNQEGEGIWVEKSTVGTINNTGTIVGKYAGIVITSNSNVQTINNTGTIMGENGSGKGIQVRGGSRLNTLIISNGGTVNGGIHNVASGSYNNISGTINTLNLNNGATVNGGIYNDGTMGSVSVGDSTVTGDINNGSKATMNNITVMKSTITGNITNKNNITGNISISDGSTITGNITNEKTIGGNISITGTSNVGGSIVNQNGATFNNQITLDQNSKLGGITNAANSTMSGQLTLNGEVGTITNAGTFDSQLNLSNKVGEINNAEGGTISNDITIQANGSVGAINNAGTMQAITNNGTGTLTLTNQGKIEKGIVNSGTLVLTNDFRKDPNASGGFTPIGQIGKTTNDVHIENTGSGKVTITDWYFAKLENTTQEERKNNSLLVGGDAMQNIIIDRVFINTADLDTDKTYNAYSLIADKDGNAVGDKINNGQGIASSKLASVSGIYNFEGFGGNGQYRASINRDELSGRTLAQSIIYSQRVRNVNLSRILREATTQVFVSGKESETNANGKSLGQLEQLHTNHRDQNSQNHTFVIPYYQNFSADLGSETGKLKSNSSGMLIATQRQLPNDYGVLGIYTGFENADQKVNAQRLEMDGNSYYAGLTYNHSFYEDDLTTYFMNLTTKLDYIERDVTKTYRGYIGSASSTAKVFGYGANARVGFSHYLKNDAKISPQIGLNYLGMHNKPFTLNHLGGTREHYLAQNFNFIDAVATIKYETPWINRFKTAVALGTIINVYKDAKGTLHLDSNVLNAELDIARLYGVVQGGISYDLTKDSDISLGYSGIFSSANTIRSHAFMFRYAWWW